MAAGAVVAQPQQVAAQQAVAQVQQAQDAGTEEAHPAASQQAQQKPQDAMQETQASMPSTPAGQAAQQPAEEARPANAQAPADDVQPASSATSVQAAPQDASRLWASILAHLKKIGPAFGVIFMNTATSMSDGKLVIAFEPTSDFAFKAAQKQDAREALEKAMERAGAQGMPYEIVKGEPGQVKGARQAQPQPEPQPAVQQPQPEPQPVAQAAEPQPQPAAQTAEPQPQPDPHPVAQPQPAAQQQQQPQPQPADDTFPTPGAIPVDAQSGSTPEVQESADPDFQDFLASAFGEGIVVEEIQE